MVGTQQCIPDSNTHVYTVPFLTQAVHIDAVIMMMFIMSFVYPRQYL